MTLADTVILSYWSFCFYELAIRAGAARGRLKQAQVLERTIKKKQKKNEESRERKKTGKIKEKKKRKDGHTEIAIFVDGRMILG